MGKTLMENEGNPLPAALKPHFMEYQRRFAPVGTHWIATALRASQ